MEMRFLRATEGCTRRDKIKNTDIQKELKIYSIMDKIVDNRREWAEYINRMGDNRLPKEALNDQPQGKRGLGRMRKR